MVGVIDVAQAYKVPPTTILQLPYEPWGETDCLLIMARETLRAALCPCGCGQYADEAHNAASEWTVDETVCRAGAALEKHRKDHPDPPYGQMLNVRRKDAKSEASEYESLRARFNL